MARRKTDRDEVVEQALELFRVNGYHRTSMAEISAACGLLKGSMYHYFPSKEALAVAALEHIIDHNHGTIISPAYDDGRPEKERLAAFAQALEDYFIDRDGGCLMGNLALEACHSVPAFVPFIRRYFGECTAALAHLLKSAHDAGRARELAEDSLAALQGSIMLMRVYGSAAPLKRATGALARLLD